VAAFKNKARADLYVAAEVCTSGVGVMGAVSMLQIVFMPTKPFRDLAESGELRLLLFLGALCVSWVSIVTIWKSVRGAATRQAVATSAVQPPAGQAGPPTGTP
jgi:hypothetical protein